MSFGLVAGFAIGIVFTVVIFAAWFNTLSQALVGVGTLAISFVALYQSRLGIEERHKRELAERVYAPLRAEVVKWLDPEEQTFNIWNELQAKELYWTKKLPKDITSLLNSGRGVFKKLLEAKISVNLSTFEETSRLGNEIRVKLGLPEQKGSPPTIAVRTGYQDVGYVYPTNLWVSRKSFRDYASSLVNKMFPNQAWTVVFLLDGKPYGGLPEAEEFVEKVNRFYEGQAPARELRTSSEELKTLGSKLLVLIDKELG